MVGAAAAQAAMGVAGRGSAQAPPSAGRSNAQPRRASSTRVPSVSGRCLNCGRQGGEHLFTLSGCKSVCYVCSKCYLDATVADGTLLTAIDRACKICLPILATRLAGRCCVGCRRYSAYESILCNCAGRHYICRDCTQSTTAALKAHAALKAMHTIDTSARRTQTPAPKQAQLLARTPTPGRTTSTPNWRVGSAADDDSVPVERMR